MRNIVATVVFAAMAMVGSNAAAHKVNPKNNTQCIMTCGNGSSMIGSCSNGWTQGGCDAAGGEYCKDKGGLAAGFPKLSGGKGNKFDVAFQQKGKAFVRVKATSTGTSTGVIRPIMISDENQPIKKNKKKAK